MPSSGVIVPNSFGRRAAGNASDGMLYSRTTIIGSWVTTPVRPIGGTMTKPNKMLTSNGLFILLNGEICERAHTTMHAPLPGVPLVSERAIGQGKAFFSWLVRRAIDRMTGWMSEQPAAVRARRSRLGAGRRLWTLQPSLHFSLDTSGPHSIESQQCGSSSVRSRFRSGSRRS